MITKKSRRSLNIFEKMIVQTVCLACMSSILFSCAPASTTSAVHDTAPAAIAQVTQENLPKAQQAGPDEHAMLPVRFQKPSYLVKGAEMDQGETAASQDAGIKVGADISSPTPMTLRDILKILAEEKGMTISWASDVDQNLKVDVGIGATDDFSRSLENLLRQVDYFHEIEGNTIVVKYMETRNFHLAMPPRITGSDAAATSSVSSVTVEDSSTRWKEIEDNLTQMLARWETERPSPAPAVTPDGEGASTTPPAESQTGNQNLSTIVTVDRSIGLITVTAPLRILKKVDSYLENFKKELYRQVSIEAKIVEVTLNDTASTGIDWSSLVKNKNVTVSLFEGTGVLYPTGFGRKAFSQATVDPSFNLVVNAIQEYGDTKVLSNPKISVMNGQPAVIYVGESIRYISEITTTVSDSGIPTYSTATADAISGLRFEIVPNIVNDEEIIMSLIPTISGVKRPIPERQVGSTTVGLPEIKQRTMNSIVRIGNGEMLVVGGLIDDTNDEQQSKVPILGDLPFIKKAFNNTTKTKIRKELIILLRPSII